METRPPVPTDETFSPEGPARKPRGCVFYGCLIAVVLGAIVLILVGLGLWAGYRMASQFVEQYAEDAPAPIPVAELPVPQLDAVKARIARFRQAIEAGAATAPLTLTSEEINALIASVPGFKGTLAVDLAGDRLHGKISLPIERLGFPADVLFPGKYLNGAATLEARIVDGRLFVALVGLEVKGKPLPAPVLESLRAQNLAEEVNKDPKNAEMLARIESIAVKDGKLILTPRRPDAKPEPAEAPE